MFLSQFAAYAYIACAGPTTKRLGTVELGCSGRDVFWGYGAVCSASLVSAPCHERVRSVAATTPADRAERLNPGAEPAYGKIEEQLAALCARMKAPNRYLA